MSSTNYIDNSIKIKDVAIQRKKLYKVSFVDKSSITTQIIDAVPFATIYSIGVQSLNPRSFKDILKYNAKFDSNDRLGKRYNTDHILTYQIISSKIESVLMTYEYSTKGWFGIKRELKDIHINWPTLIGFGYDINDPYEDMFKTSRRHSVQLKNLKKFLETEIIK